MRILFRNPNEFALDFAWKHQEKVLLLLFYCKKTLLLYDFFAKKVAASPLFLNYWLAAFPGAFWKKPIIYCFFTKIQYFLRFYYKKILSISLKSASYCKYATYLLQKVSILENFFVKKRHFCRLFTTFNAFLMLF